MDKNSEKQTVLDTNMQANFSALLYLLTEQHALIGRLFKELLDAGVLGDQQLTKITNLYGEEDALTPVYSDLYKRFAYYYLKFKAFLETREEDEAVSEVPKEEDKEEDDG